MSSRGLYLVNGSGEMSPVHTEDGGDETLLREYFEEHDVDGVTVETDGRRPFDEQLTELNEQFQDAGYGGLMLAGRIGYHTFYNNSGSVTDAFDTALHMALDEVLQELWMDADIIRDRQGEVTPETVAAEFEQQFDEFTGFNFSEHFAEAVERKLSRIHEVQRANGVSE